MELTRRQTEMLLYLIQERKPKYGSELADRFSVTDRTVRNDIQKINMNLSEYQVAIKGSRQEGYYISNENISRIRDEKIIQTIARQFDFDIPETQNERMVYLLFSMLFGNQYTQEDIEELFYLSPSVVYGDLKATENWLRGRRIGVELKKSKGYYYIDEEESLIRSLISGIYTQRSNLVLELKYSYFISGNVDFWEMANDLIPFVCDFIRKENLSLSGYSIFSFCIDIAISYYRTNYGFDIVEKSPLPELEKRLAQALVQYDDLFAVLKDDDYSYLINRLKGKDYIGENPFITVNEHTSDMVSDFTGAVEKLGKSVVHPEYIVHEMEAILYIKKHRYYYSVYGRRQIFEKNLDALYLTVLLGYFCHVYYPEIKLNKHDYARLTCCLRESISSVKKKIMLVSDSNRFDVEALRKKTQALISEKGIIEKVTNQYEYASQKDGIDGIITTVSINEPIIPCLEISLYSLDESFGRIMAFMESLYGQEMKAYEETTDIEDLEEIISDLLRSLESRGLITIADTDHVFHNIKESTIFRMKKNTLMLMNPLISSEQPARFDIICSGEYSGDSYDRISLLAFSDNINMIADL